MGGKALSIGSCRAAHLAPGRKLRAENAKTGAATQQKPKSLAQLDLNRLTLEVREAGMIKVKSPAFRVKNYYLAITWHDLADRRDCHPVLFGFFGEGARVRRLHGCNDLVIIAGSDQISEQIWRLGDGLGSSSGQRRFCRLDCGADARGLAEFRGVDNKPVGDVDGGACALAQRQHQRVACRRAPVAFDEEVALVVRKPPFLGELRCLQKPQSKGGIADRAADTESVAGHGTTAKYRLSLWQHPHRGDGYGEGTRRGGGI